MSKARGYCFTLNNYTEDDYNSIICIASVYLIVGKEVGESGTPHLQGFIYFENPRAFSAVKKMIPKAHIEPMKGTAMQASEYCKKDKDFFEKGEMPRQGTRTDLDEIRKVLQETNKMSEVVKVATSYQSVKMAEQILKYHEKPRNWKPKVLWFYGPTGSGKSKLAYEMLGEDCYTCLTTGRWFDGYDAHENVLIDDFRKDFMKFHDFLRLLDRYAYRVETKGGTRQFLAKNIVITSAYSPDVIYDTREDVQQLLRRIDQIKYIDYPKDLANDDIRNYFL